MRLYFRASNNEVEYETLLIGLKTSQNVGASQVLVHLDFQLLVKQVKGALISRMRSYRNNMRLWSGLRRIL